MLTHLHEITDTSIFDTCELVGLTRARYTGESSGRFFRSTQAQAPVWINGIKLSAGSPGSYSIFLNVLRVTVFMIAVGLRTNRLEQWLSNSHLRQMPPVKPNCYGSHRLQVRSSGVDSQSCVFQKFPMHHC